MRSTPRKPAWPSFMWNTSGAGRPSTSVKARIARTPPIPARISCLIRCSWSPPYSRSVTPRRSCSFSGMSESKQQQRNSADLRDPDARAQLAGVRHRQLDQHRVAGLVGEQPQRQALRIQRRIILVLPAVGGQRLPEVPGAVVQPDRDQRQAQIRRRLQVVAGQNARARRNSSAAPRRRRTPSRSRRCRSAAAAPSLGLLLVPQRPGQVVVQVGGQRVEALHERLVGRPVRPAASG